MKKIKRRSVKKQTVKKDKSLVLTTEEMQVLLSECFYTDSEDFKSMWNIIDYYLKNESKNSCIEKHHIIPRSYFTKVGRSIIDNGNLVSLPAFEHYKVHYFAYKCARPLMERSMTFAFNFMAKKCMKISDSNDLLISSQMYEQFREDHRKSISRSMKDYYSDEKTRNDISKRVSEKWNDPDYKKRLKDIDKECWVKRREQMFPNETKNEVFKSEIKLISECLGKVPNRVAANIFGETRKWLTEDQQKLLGVDSYIAKEKTVSKETLYICDELGFIGSKKDLSDVFCVAESVIAAVAKSGKKLNGLSIRKEEVHTFKFFHEIISKVLYPLYKKQGEHLFDTLREIFNKMDKLSND